MDGASLQFLAFGLVVALISNFSRSRVWRSSVLMVASLIFLGLLSHNAMAFVPLFGFLLWGYVAIALLRAGWSRSLAWSVVATIVAYAWLKKYTLIPAGLLLHHPYFTLGLSYIIFRVLHLLVEASEKGKKLEINPGSYLLYTINFTTLVSGPLQPYKDFARDQFTDEPIELGVRTVGSQLERIVVGFFKVNVLGMVLHVVQQDALAQLSQPLPTSAKLYASFRLAVAFPFFLYANFSGYIDIVLALARLMRVRLPENFNRPFSATSFLDFWSRWHMSLSNWLQTYVYNGLMMAVKRRIASRAIEPFLEVSCFFVTFFLIGIWHGRTTEFVAFGVLQGGGVSINKLWQVMLTRSMGKKGYKKLAANPLYEIFGRGLAFTWFAFTLYWFWGSWAQIHAVFTALTVVETVGVWLAVWLIASAALALWEWVRAGALSVRTADGPVLDHRYVRVVYASALALVALAIVLLDQPAPDIVYKAF